jgi:hypothetical protein
VQSAEAANEFAQDPQEAEELGRARARPFQQVAVLFEPHAMAVWQMIFDES